MRPTAATPDTASAQPAPAPVEIANGIPAEQLGTEGWHKPWSGQNGGSCLEAKRLPHGQVAIRQSTDPAGPALVCHVSGFAAFLQGAKEGRADFLVR